LSVTLGNCGADLICGGANAADDTPDLVKYNLDATDLSPITDGVPGVISYCVYPSQPPGNPTSATATVNGANGAAWGTSFGSIQGFFAFTRPDGNPSNIPLDGTTGIQVGTANWPALTAPDSDHQVILLHINDAAECDALYGGNPGTCFVFPTGGENLPGGCPGLTPACKEVVIDQACTTEPLTVPEFTKLNIHYTYVITNTSDTCDMVFDVPTNKTKDINSGGGKDYFGCEQIPDPSGIPGSFGTFGGNPATGALTFTSPLNGAAWKFDFQQGGGVCNQSRFFLTANAGSITLPPGGTITFSVDMTTRTNKGGKQEYTSLGDHFLNSGFTVKWFERDGSTCDGLLHSYSTNVTPLVVNVVNSCTP
jgi:hypothetical protein